jgi:hypothetical protein
VISGLHSPLSSRPGVSLRFQRGSPGEFNPIHGLPASDGAPSSLSKPGHRLSRYNISAGAFHCISWHAPWLGGRSDDEENMNFMRLHWFDIGLALAVITGGILLLVKPNPLSLLLWVSLISLFLHQFEEYRYPGYFPGMMNAVMFSSKEPDRYPHNTNTALVVNVFVGWLPYLLAAVFGARALWLAIATMLISLGNFVAHTFIFNIRGKTRYNPGMFTAVVLFLPIAATFGYLVIKGNLATPGDWIVGVVLGVALNFIGILKVIDWLKDRNTNYVFPKRSLLPSK